MKKIFAIMAIAMLSLSVLVSCSSDDDTNNSEVSNVSSVGTGEGAPADETTAPEDETTAPEDETTAPEDETPALGDEAPEEESPAA